MALSAIWEAGTKFLALARRVDKLFELQTRIDASLEIIDERLRAVEDRLLRVAAAGPRLITEARCAASAAATAMSGAALNDVVTRLTRVEVKLEALDRGAGAQPPGAPRLSGPKRGARKTGGDSAEG